MDNSRDVEITVTLSSEDAWAVSEFIKRAGFDDYRRLAVDDKQARDMISGFSDIREALDKEGV